MKVTGRPGVVFAVTLVLNGRFRESRRVPILSSIPSSVPYRTGLRGRQLLHSIAGTMVGSATMFGFFLTVGYGLRCEPGVTPAPVPGKRGVSV